MSANNPCPCCSDSMLRHLSKQHSYWYCPSCRIEMPLIEHQKLISQKSRINFSTTSIKAMINTKETVKSIADLPRVI